MSQMNLCEDSEVQPKCFKCKERLYGSLNIAHKDTEKTLIFWNKYQIFLYEDLNFESATKEFTPEFQIDQLLVYNNYIICIDCNGNVHTTSLKFKNAGQKRFKSSFQPREQGVLCCFKYSPEYLLSLKKHSEIYYMCLHKINAELQLEKEVALEINDKDWPMHLFYQENKVKRILACQAVSKEVFGTINQLFQENLWRNHSLVLISFDKLTVYGCLFSQKSSNDVISLKKLYTSPTEICDIKIIEKTSLKVLIALTCGTLVQLRLNSNNKRPDAIHLNTSLSKIMTIRDSIIYTDGMVMWKAENLDSKENINFQQYFVKDVKDFIKCNYQLICTTFTNLIYLFSIEDKTSFFEKHKELYSPAEKLLNNSEYLFRINKEIEKNKEIINKINDEGNYLTAVSLSRRQDVMDKLIQENIILYDEYEEVIKDNIEITLTEELHEYFKPESILILIKIAVNPIQHNLSNILVNILENLKIHITLSTEGKVLKTTLLKSVEPLKKLKILIPLERYNITQVNAEIQLVSEIPGVLNRKETLWTVLHRKVFMLTAEQFIKTSSSDNKIKYLKYPKSKIGEMIIKTAENQHGNLFQITEATKCDNQEINLSFYVKLPNNYNEILKNYDTFKSHFHSQKASYISQLLSSEEFLKSKGMVIFEIGSERVNIAILNDEFSNPLLKISCDDVKIAFEVRNFFANVFYGHYKTSSEEFVSNALYTTTENLQKELRQCSSLEDCLMLAERLHKNIIGTLPL